MSGNQLPDISVRAPLVGGDLWTAVAVHRADGRCQCRTECGNQHTSGHGACRREQSLGRPLRVVPRVAVSARAAAGLGADDLMAVCASCHDGLARARRTAHEVSAAQAITADSLF